MVGISNAKEGKLLYHLTKVENFQSIVRNGLLSRRSVTEHHIGFYNVADMNIIGKRKYLGLDTYVPFHFHPYSAFDVAVKNTYDAQHMLYICIYREFARRKGFKILPKHPLSMDSYQLYDYDTGFNIIDWETLMRKNDTTEYAKEVKMAECLSEQVIQLCDFACIFVPNKEVENEIIQIMDGELVGRAFQPRIFPQPKWFENYESAF